MELIIRDVSKTYANGVQALKDVTLTIPAGMYGLLGPNGAGKSTLMRTLATLQEAETAATTATHPGDIDVLNAEGRVRKTLGYLPQEFGVYPKVSAEDLLDHFALLKGIAGRRRAQRGRGGAAPPDEPVGRAQAEAGRLLGWHAAALRRRGRAAGQPAAAHRGRADRRPRPRRARALPEPAQRARARTASSSSPRTSSRTCRELCTRMAIIDRGEILLEAEPLRRGRRAARPDLAPRDRAETRCPRWSESTR